MSDARHTAHDAALDILRSEVRTRLASYDSILGVVDRLPASVSTVQTPIQEHCAVRPSGYRPLTDIRAPHHDRWQGDGRPAVQLVGRDVEMDRIHAFLTAARTSGGALLVTGEPGVGKTGLLDAAADIATAGGTRVLRAAGIQFEAEMSFSGLNQVLLPLLDGLPQLAVVHRDALNVALGFGEGAPPSRLVVSNAALVLLRQAAAARPLLVDPRRPALVGPSQRRRAQLRGPAPRREPGRPPRGIAGG